MKTFENRNPFDIENLSPDAEISLSPQSKVGLIKELENALADLNKSEKTLKEFAKEMGVPVRKIQNANGGLAHLALVTARIEALSALSRLA